MVGPGANASTTQCYKVLTGNKTWLDYERQCMLDGAHLTSIHTASQDNFVSEIGKSVLNGCSGVLNCSISTGGQGFTNGSGNWTDQSSWSYAHWAPGEPSYNQPMAENCSSIVITAHISYTSLAGYEWNAISCSQANVGAAVCGMDCLCCK
ncbi:lectin c-type domain-containing protein [Ditylenchus destructor]|uniref:Lectin c-type domain-containing protein n=1 Tax=Ditylenchus destructor TaxID=166010 RepID=A0AAD4MGF4_9BILA|nr:lectin c-type domain-containing protein [Ditylenchus destructor]